MHNYNCFIIYKYQLSPTPTPIFKMGTCTSRDTSASVEPNPTTLFSPISRQPHSRPSTPVDECIYCNGEDSCMPDCPLICCLGTKHTPQCPTQCLYCQCTSCKEPRLSCSCTITGFGICHIGIVDFTNSGTPALLFPAHHWLCPNVEKNCAGLQQNRDARNIRNLSCEEYRHPM